MNKLTYTCTDCHAHANIGRTGVQSLMLPKGSDGVFYYSVGLDEDINKFQNRGSRLDDAIAQIDRAFHFWSRVSGGNFKFKYTGSYGNSDFHIQFTRKDHYDSVGCPIAFDGERGVLAHAFFPDVVPTELKGHIHIDLAEKWVMTESDFKAFGDYGVDLYTVMKHEIWHAFGFNHLKNDELLGEYYNGPGSIMSLMASEIFKAKYGPYYPSTKRQGQKSVFSWLVALFKKLFNL